MRVASFPGGEALLTLGRVPSTSAERARFPIGEGASPVDVAASAANGEPVSPSSRNQKKHLQHSESMAFDMLFDSMDGGAPDMEDIEEGEEDYGDSDQDAHDPVSVYVRYATRGPARPTPREAHRVDFFCSRLEPRLDRRAFSRLPNRQNRPLASNGRSLSKKSKKYPTAAFGFFCLSANPGLLTRLGSREKSPIAIAIGDSVFERDGLFAFGVFFFFAAREFLSSQRLTRRSSSSSRPKIFPPLRTPARLSPFSDSPLKSRIVRQLSRPSSRVVQAIAKRFAAACAEVGPGEVGDAAHIDAVRRAFHAYDYDPWGEPVRRRPRSPESDSRSEDDEYGTYPETDHVGDQAFVATTPGAVGHAALLNLRHSFLWLKVDLEGDAALDPSAAPGDSLHPSGFAEAKAAAAISERAALAHAPVPIARSGAIPTTAHGEETRLRGPTALGETNDACETFASASSGSSSAVDAENLASPSTVLVMEPDIKAHFVISRPTPAYARLVDALPSTFVGTHQTLVRLVDFMCEQMNGSFRESGMSVPPWRKNKAILSKWFLPTATSRSHPATPSGSPEQSLSKVKKQDSGRRMSFDLVGGGDVVGVGVSYDLGGAFENVAPTRVSVRA